MRATALIATPTGMMIAEASSEGITRLDFARGDETVSGTSPLLERLRGELAEYFAGTLQTFTVPLAPEGTPFQQGVWEVLRTIPYGTTLSYAQEAARMGRPSAVRAVANANGRNPIAILIPCHRVIATGGGLGGYSGGLEYKKFLLRMEGVPPFRAQ